MSSGSHGWNNYRTSCGLDELEDFDSLDLDRRVSSSVPRRWSLRLVTGILVGVVVLFHSV